MNSFTELMSYFRLEMVIYYATLAVPLVNVMKMLRRKEPSRGIEVGLDSLVHVLILVGIFCGGVFQGVVADLSEQNEHITWVYRLLVIAAIHLALGIAYLVLAYKKRDKASA